MASTAVNHEGTHNKYSSSSNNSNQDTSPEQALSTVSSSTSSSVYFHRRFEGRCVTRREALAQKFGSKSPKHLNASSKQRAATTASSSISSSVQTAPKTPPRLRVNMTAENEHGGHSNASVTAASDQVESRSRLSLRYGSPDRYAKGALPSNNSAVGESSQTERPPTKPQHETFPQPASTSSYKYYRVVYRGVVSLLDDPVTTSQRSGAYVSYGEIIASLEEKEVNAQHDERSSNNSNNGGGHDSNPIPMEPVSPPRHRLGSAIRTPILSDPNWKSTNNRTPSSTSPQLPSPPPSVISRSIASLSSLDTNRTSSTFSKQAPSTTGTTTTTIRSVCKVIRVDQVLTGGYAMDGTDVVDVAPQRTASAVDQTPKRTNHAPSSTVSMPIVGPSPLPIAADSSPITYASPPQYQNKRDDRISMDPLKQKQDGSHHGYIFSQRQNVPILEPLHYIPRCETGQFWYKVVSSTPLALLTGPSIDAPRTKAMILPGTVHEVCLRVTAESSQNSQNDASTVFLRLSRRRGWIADRKLAHKTSAINRSFKTIPVLKEVCQDDMTTSDDSSIISFMTASANTVATPVSAAHRRHRPPRKRRDNRRMGDTVDGLGPLPRHIVGPSRGADNSMHNISVLSNYSVSDASPLTHPNPRPDHHQRGVLSPTSNISLLSDESSVDNAAHIQRLVNNSIGGSGGAAITPDRSVARSAASTNISQIMQQRQPSFFLMRVNAPRGLKILDAPHFQVNNLIHGNHPGHAAVSPTQDISSGGNQSIFHTMAGGQHTTTHSSKTGDPAIFDSITKARKLPRGTVFEASKRMEASGAAFISQGGAGLIKLSDNSGWAIVPRQEELDEQYRHYHGALSSVREGEATRAFEEVGNAIVNETYQPIYIRILARGGVAVSLPPHSHNFSDEETSPTSSAGGSSALSVGASLSNSDVTSSVGSSFLDAMFRTPKKKDPVEVPDSHRQSLRGAVTPIQQPTSDRLSYSTAIPCGMCVEVDPWTTANTMLEQKHIMIMEYARLRGGQGWVPRQLNGRAMVETVSPPEFRNGSFWFRVQSRSGIKVRRGPSRKAISIKSDDGVYFRFECGEYLRASEIMTVFKSDAPSECFAKLYRNRHVQLHNDHSEYRPLASLTAEAEWVQVFSEDELYLEECATEPRMERHKQGWRYNVVLDARIPVRKGPSLLSERNGVTLLGGESVVIIERAIGPGEHMTWLRLKDGQGWVHDKSENGEPLMILHEPKYRRTTKGSRSARSGHEKQDDIAYNTIITKLFHSDLPDEGSAMRKA